MIVHVCVSYGYTVTSIWQEVLNSSINIHMDLPLLLYVTRSCPSLKSITWSNGFTSWSGGIHTFSFGNSITNVLLYWFGSHVKLSSLQLKYKAPAIANRPDISSRSTNCNALIDTDMLMSCVWSLAGYTFSL